MSNDSALVNDSLDPDHILPLSPSLPLVEPPTDGYPQAEPEWQLSGRLQGLP